MVGSHARRLARREQREENRKGHSPSPNVLSLPGRKQGAPCGPHTTLGRASAVSPKSAGWSCTWSSTKRMKCVQALQSSASSAGETPRHSSVRVLDSGSMNSDPACCVSLEEAVMLLMRAPLSWEGSSGSNALRATWLGEREGAQCGRGRGGLPASLAIAASTCLAL